MTYSSERARASALGLAALAAALLLCALACRDRSAPAAGDARPTITIFGLPFTRELARGDVELFRHAGPLGRIQLTVTANVRPEAAEALIAERASMFESVFARRRTGYPGQHTRYEEVPADFRPMRFQRPVSGGNLEYFTAFATRNFVHGASSDDLAAYRSLRGYLYCAERRALLEVNFFTDRGHEERLEELLARVTCDLAAE